MGRLREYGRQKITALLMCLSLICFALSLFRCYYSGTTFFLFMNWNLFLAFVPWACSSIVIVFPAMQKNRIVAYVMLVIWLLFFPNAPYILTDLVHLKARGIVPIWFDLILLVSFAWTGLLFGFVSLFDLEYVFKTFIRPKYVTIMSVMLLYAASYGIYLGRFLRFNSWDVVSDPFMLIRNIMDSVDSLRAWGVTLTMCLLLNMFYWSFKAMSSVFRYG